MGLRRDEMFAAVDTFNRAHNEWSADPNRPNPDTTYWDAFDELINVFETGGIPGDCRELAEGVDKFAIEEDAFSNRDDHSTDMPHQAFFKARERLEVLCKPKIVASRRPLETVKQLAAEKVSHDQIARMYGLYGKNGQPASWLVQKELDEPGSVITPEVLAKLENAQGESEEAEYERTEEERAQQLSRKQRRAKAVEDKPCPETAEELWLQNVGAPQASRMLMKPEADVVAMFQQFEKARDKRKAELAAQATVKAVQAAQDGPQGDSQDDSDTDIKIASMIEQGFSKESIVETLGVDGRTVAAAFRRLKKEPAGA